MGLGLGRDGPPGKALQAFPVGPCDWLAEVLLRVNHSSGRSSLSPGLLPRGVRWGPWVDGPGSPLSSFKGLVTECKSVCMTHGEVEACSRGRFIVVLSKNR